MEENLDKIVKSFAVFGFIFRYYLCKLVRLLSEKCVTGMSFALGIKNFLMFLKNRNVIKFASVL